MLWDDHDSLSRDHKVGSQLTDFLKPEINSVNKLYSEIAQPIKAQTFL